MEAHALKTGICPSRVQRAAIMRQIGRTTMVSEVQYREEVAELTAMLRNDADWEDLRRVVSAKGLNPSTLLLASFMEDEHGTEYGTLVTPAGQVTEYSRKVDFHPLEQGLMIWRDRTGDNDYQRLWPQVSVALRMLRHR